jgi:NAD-dependent dihydropyrimidine dehydrogenase PreA subunit
MIELVSSERCIGCDVCAKICPTNVFDFGHGEAPAIARKEDCQTCFLCEAYCPADALYVAPESDRSLPVDEAQLVAEGKLGRYREILGWGPGRTPNSRTDAGYLLKTLDRFRRLAGAGAPPSPPPTESTPRP